MQTAYHPAFGDSPILYSVREVSEDPEIQVGQVIGMMRGYVRDDVTDPYIQADAADSIGAADGDPTRDVFAYVKPRIVFQRDEVTAAPFQPHYDGTFVESLIRPADMSRMIRSQGQGIGDCDDFSMYTAALLEARGIKTGFVTIAANPEYQREFSHVYVAAYPKDGQRVLWHPREFSHERIPVDTSHGPGAGWESPVCFRMQEWPIEQSYGWLVGVGAAGLAFYLAHRKGLV